MAKHILIEINGGVLTHVDVPPGFTVWLRDYDHLRDQGLTWREAEATPPTVWSGERDAQAPERFTLKVP